MSLLVNCFSPASKMLKLLFCVKYTHEISDANCYIREQARLSLVSLAAVFWMSRNFPPKETSLGGTLCDIQKTAARETRSSYDWMVWFLKKLCPLRWGSVTKFSCLLWWTPSSLCVFSAGQSSAQQQEQNLYLHDNNGIWNYCKSVWTK